MSLPTPPVQTQTQQHLHLTFPGWQGLTEAAIQVWVCVALLGFGCGVTWRYFGSGPGVFELFDMLGFVYWLTPLMLIEGWETMRSRQTRHVSRGRSVYGSAIPNALLMAGYLALLSLAPLGLFTAVGNTNSAANIFSDLFDTIELGYPEFTFVTLLLSGTAVLLLSLNCLIGCRRIVGTGAGVIAWGVIGTLLNITVITSIEVLDFNFSFAGLATIARDTLNLGLIDPAQAAYVADSAKKVYGVIVAAITALAAVLVAVQTPYSLSRKRHNVYWLPSVVGMLIPAIYAMAHTSQWVGDPSIARPWDWPSLLLAGLVPMLVVNTLNVWQQETQQSPQISLDGLLLLWLCPLAWITFSSPVVQAGLVGKLQLVLAAAECMVLIVIWLLFTNFVAKAKGIHPVLGGVLLAAVLSILVIPLDGGQQSGVAYLLVKFSTAFSGSQLIIAASVCVVTVVLLALTVWKLNGRRISRPKTSPR